MRCVTEHVHFVFTRLECLQRTGEAFCIMPKKNWLNSLVINLQRQPFVYVIDLIYLPGCTQPVPHLCCSIQNPLIETRSSKPRICVYKVFIPRFTKKKQDLGVFFEEL